MNPKKNKNRKIYLCLLILIFSSSLYAQGESKAAAAKNLSVKLQQKVLLSNEQTKKVEDILIDYINLNDKSSQPAADKRISSLLDEKQKAKYEIVKADLWSEINRAASGH